VRPGPEERCNVRNGSTPVIGNSEPNFCNGPIPLKNSENEGRQKIGIWSCRADSATRCRRQFATAAAHRKISLSAEPVALSS
jgi:hypothetical protein